MSNTNMFFSRPVDGGDNNLVTRVNGTEESFTPEQVRDSLQGGGSSTPLLTTNAIWVDPAGTFFDTEEQYAEAYEEVVNNAVSRYTEFYSSLDESKKTEDAIAPEDYHDFLKSEFEKCGCHKLKNGLHFIGLYDPIKVSAKAALADGSIENPYPNPDIAWPLVSFSQKLRCLGSPTFATENSIDFTNTVTGRNVYMPSALIFHLGLDPAITSTPGSSQWSYEVQALVSVNSQAAVFNDGDIHLRANIIAVNEAATANGPIEFVDNRFARVTFEVNTFSTNPIAGQYVINPGNRTDEVALGYIGDLDDFEGMVDTNSVLDNPNLVTGFFGAKQYGFIVSNRIYVDSDAGNDIYDGRTKQFPVKTLARANALAEARFPSSSFTVVGEPGSVFTETLTPPVILSSALINYDLRGCILSDPGLGAVDILQSMSQIYITCTRMNAITSSNPFVIRRQGIELPPLSVARTFFTCDILEVSGPVNGKDIIVSEIAFNVNIGEYINLQSSPGAFFNDTISGSENNWPKFTGRIGAAISSATPPVPLPIYSGPNPASYQINWNSQSKIGPLQLIDPADPGINLEWDMKKFPNAKIDLINKVGGSRTLINANTTGMIDGDVSYLSVRQAASGDQNIALDSGYVTEGGSGISLTQSAAAVDTLKFTFDSELNSVRVEIKSDWS